MAKEEKELMLMIISVYKDENISLEDKEFLTKFLELIVEYRG